MKTLMMCVAILCVILSDHVEAWPTSYYSDDIIVDRSELIVLACVKEGSISKISLPAKYEHRAILIVSRVIKGNLEKKEIPIMIHYGLLPVAVSSERYMATEQSVPEVEGEAVKIHEDNPSEGFFRSSGDVHQDQIWFLRHHRLPSPRDHHDDGETTDLFGIWDPEDLQAPANERKLSPYLHFK